MERSILRGLLYVVFAFTAAAFFGIPPSDREGAVIAGVAAVVALGALAISARVEPEPTTEERPAVGAARPTKAGASRPTV